MLLQRRVAVVRHASRNIAVRVAVAADDVKLRLGKLRDCSGGWFDIKALAGARFGKLDKSVSDVEATIRRAFSAAA